MIDTADLNDLFEGLLDGEYKMQCLQGLTIGESSDVFTPCSKQGGSRDFGSMPTIKPNQDIFYKLYLKFAFNTRKNTMDFMDWRDYQLSLFHGIKYLSDNNDFHSIKYSSDHYLGFEVSAFFDGFKITDPQKLRSTMLYLWKIYAELCRNPKSDYTLMRPSVGNKILLYCERFNVYSTSDFLEEANLFKDVKNVIVSDKYIEIETNYEWSQEIKN